MPYPLGHWVTTGSGFSLRLLTRCHHRAPPLRSAASRGAVCVLGTAPNGGSARLRPWPRSQADPRRACAWVPRRRRPALCGPLAGAHLLSARGSWKVLFPGCPLGASEEL